MMIIIVSIIGILVGRIRYGFAMPKQRVNSSGTRWAFGKGYIQTPLLDIPVIFGGTQVRAWALHQARTYLSPLFLVKLQKTQS
jgi:hypothetical protein